MPAKPAPASPALVTVRAGARVLAISGSVVWSGNQDNFLVNSAKRSKFSIERTVCGPHNQNPVIWFQEFQNFGKLLFQAFRLNLGERKKENNVSPHVERTVKS